MRIALWFVGFATVLVVALVLLYRSQYTTFRYRITVELTVSGEPRTASTIVQAQYYIPFGGPLFGSYLKWSTRVKGTAPILDLGNDGWLIAALQYYNTLDDLKIKYRRRGNDPRDKLYVPVNMGGMPLCAYRAEGPRTIGSFRKAIEVPPDCYPMFMWVPPSGDRFAAEQLIRADIRGKFDTRIDVSRITIEPTTSSKLLERIEKAPDWVVDIRNQELEAKERADRYEAQPPYTLSPDKIAMSTLFIESKAPWERD